MATEIHIFQQTLGDLEAAVEFLHPARQLWKFSEKMLIH